MLSASPRLELKKFTLLGSYTSYKWKLGRWFEKFLSFFNIFLKGLKEDLSLVGTSSPRRQRVSAYSSICLPIVGCTGWTMGYGKFYACCMLSSSWLTHFTRIILTRRGHRLVAATYAPPPHILSWLPDAARLWREYSFAGCPWYTCWSFWLASSQRGV